MAGMVGFCGSRDLPALATVSALVSRVVGSVLAGVPRRYVAVGCAVGVDALVVSSALALGASSRIRVFAAFGPVSPPWPAARVSCSRRVFLRLLGLRRGRRPRRRRLRLLVGRGRSLSPPGRPPRLPLLGTRLGGRSVRCGPRLRRVRLLTLPGRPRSLSFSLGMLLRLRFRVVGLARARLGPRAPRRSLPRRCPRLCRALRTRSRRRGARGSHSARLARVPPGREVSASCPLLRPSSAARRGTLF